jgi:hypothetical protein
LLGDIYEGSFVRKPPVWEHYNIHLGRHAQGCDEREIELHLGALYKGAMPIKADTHGSLRYDRREVRLDVLDDLLPRFILTHDAYRQREGRIKRGDISPGGVLVTGRR